MGKIMRFEVFEHTADAGIKAYGHSLKALFENAAFGMFSLIADLNNVKSTGEFKVELKANDKEQLLVDWLGELIYIHEVYNVLLKDFEIELIKGDGDIALSGVVRGEAIDEDRHTLKTVVKAVTYHMLEINEEKGYLAVIFDV